MVMLLVATAMAVLLAGCGSSQREDQGSRQGSEQEDGSSKQTSEAMTNEQTSEPTMNETVVGSSQQTPEPTTDERVVGHCAESGSTGGQQEEAGRGDVFNGKIVFTRSNEFQDASDIYVVDEEGAHETKLTCTKKFEVDPIWSPDGQKIAFIKNSDLYVMNADGTKQTQLAEYVWEASPAWSPDGQKIAFTRGQIQPGELYVINADGTNEAHLITDSISGNSEDRTQVGSPAWSPDGNKIAFASRTQTDTRASSSSAAASAPVEGLSGIYLINADGTGLPKLTSPAQASWLDFHRPAWSPDGKKMFFYDLGAIYVINADGSDRKELTSGTDIPPQFALSPDGKRIAFVDTSKELNVINADGSGQRRLTNTPGPSSVALPTWSPDSEKLAYSCPFEDPLHAHTDLCVINADGTEWKRIASKVAPVGFQVGASWGRG
jgi:TolB protein